MDPHQHVHTEAETTPAVSSPDQTFFADDGVQLGFPWSEHPGLSTHALHTYVAAMNPPLAQRLVDTYIPAGGSVLDPFCGGGAVLVEAVRSGRAAYGRDINHLAVLVSKAKTQHVQVEQIFNSGQSLLRYAEQYDGPLMEFPKAASVEYWFKDYMLRPLSGLRYGLGLIHADLDRVRDLFRVLLSATARSVSLTYRNEIRLRRMKPEEETVFNPNVLSVFRRHLRFAQIRVPDLPEDATSDIQREDVRGLAMPDGSVDGVVCSPPYGDERNGVNYTQFAKNMLYWLGFSREQISESKSLTLGWAKEGREPPPSSSLDDALNGIADNPSAVREAIAFYSDYQQALAEIVRVARGHIVVVIGNRVLHRQVFDNAAVTVDLMRGMGIDLRERDERHLPSKRLPRMREFGAAIDHEAILVFHKG